MRKKIEAALAVFVTSPQNAAASNIGAQDSDDVGRLDAIEPGMIEYLRAGENIATAEPKASGGYADFKRFAARDIAAGYGVPYELMTGDLSQVNYSSYRAGLVDFRRRVEQDQYALHVPIFCEAVRKRFLMELGAVSERPATGSRTTFDWTPPRFELIDPLKEAEAEVEQVLAGTEPLDEIVRRHGYPFDKHLARLAKVRDALDKYGLVLKTDMRTQLAATAKPAGGEEEDAADAA
jgi:capsid protein